MMLKKNLLLALLMAFICTDAFAEGYQTKHYVTGALGVFTNGRSRLESTTSSDTRPDTIQPTPLSGLIGLGVDYEMRLLQAVGVGVSFRHYSTKDDFPNGQDQLTKAKFKMMSMMLFGRAHINSKYMDIYVSPGFGLVDPGYETTDADGEVTTYDIGKSFGVDMTMGILYKWNSLMAFGIEHKRIYGIGSKHNGHLISDWMLIFRYKFM